MSTVKYDQNTVTRMFNAYRRFEADRLIALQLEKFPTFSVAAAQDLAYLVLDWRLAGIQFSNDNLLKIVEIMYEEKGKHSCPPLFIMQVWNQIKELFPDEEERKGAFVLYQSLIDPLFLMLFRAYNSIPPNIIFHSTGLIKEFRKHADFSDEAAIDLLGNLETLKKEHKASGIPADEASVIVIFVEAGRRTLLKFYGNTALFDVFNQIALNMLDD